VFIKIYPNCCIVLT